MKITRRQLRRLIRESYASVSIAKRVDNELLNMPGALEHAHIVSGASQDLTRDIAKRLMRAGEYSYSIPELEDLVGERIDALLTIRRAVGEVLQDMPGALEHAARHSGASQDLTRDIAQELMARGAPVFADEQLEDIVGDYIDDILSKY